MKKIKSITVMLTIIGLFMVGCKGCQTELEGTWIGDDFDQSGNNITFMFSYNTFDYIKRGMPDWSKGTFTLNTNTVPKQIDILIKEGHPERHIGKTSLGIYKIESDTLAIALNEPGVQSRPTSFEPPQVGSRLLFLTKQ